MRIAILGYGVEGKSSLRFLKKKYPNAKFEIRDQKQGRNYLKHLETFDMIARSPGVPYLTPEIKRAKKRGVVVTSATKLFFDNAKGTLVGITGTKGKGTTATLLFKILKAAGPVRKKLSNGIFLAGNIGKPMLDILLKLKRNSITILELSSFQLQDLDHSPHIAAVLDISPDHLNHHKNFQEYINAKAQIVKNHTLRAGEKNHPPNSPPYEGGGKRGEVNYPWTFFFPDNKYSKLIAQKSRGKRIAVLPNPNLILKIPGAHNVKNASMAVAIGRALGAKEKIIQKAIRNFKGLPHRLEFVREVRGVKYYNDSAATNPAATSAALSSFGAPKILIAGGQSKNLSFRPLRQALKNSNTKTVVLFGKNKNEIGSLARRSLGVGGAVDILMCEDLKSAVKTASRKAKNGDVVILSPASTAFGQFSGYGERGDYFKKLVSML